LSHPKKARRRKEPGRGWDVVETHSDEGISGTKGCDQRPGLDGMLKDAGRRRFDVAMAWAIDRLGRSLIDLLETIKHLEAVARGGSRRDRARPRRWWHPRRGCGALRRVR